MVWRDWFGTNDLKRQLDRMELNQSRRDERIMGMVEENIAKIQQVSANLDELAGDIEELKGMHEDPTALNEAIDGLVARTRAMADIVPEVEDPSDNASQSGRRR